MFVFKNIKYWIHVLLINYQFHIVKNSKKSETKIIRVNTETGNNKRPKRNRSRIYKNITVFEQLYLYLVMLLSFKRKTILSIQIIDYLHYFVVETIRNYKAKACWIKHPVAPISESP